MQDTKLSFIKKIQNVLLSNDRFQDQMWLLWKYFMPSNYINRHVHRKELLKNSIVAWSFFWQMLLYELLCLFLFTIASLCFWDVDQLAVLTLQSWVLITDFPRANLPDWGSSYTAHCHHIRYLTQYPHHKKSQYFKFISFLIAILITRLKTKTPGSLKMCLPLIIVTFWIYCWISLV